MVAMSLRHELPIRVHYHETDGQGRVHHAIYLHYFERGRVELLRTAGTSYRDIEATGLMLVVSEMNVRYLAPAAFDDQLTLVTEATRLRGARIEHHYQLLRGGELLVEAQSTIACIDRTGRVRRLPPELQAFATG
jgi:acyl-CoA thioester hydrolase